MASSRPRFDVYNLSEMGASTLCLDMNATGISISRPATHTHNPHTPAFIYRSTVRYPTFIHSLLCLCQVKSTDRLSSEGVSEVRERSRVESWEQGWSLLTHERSLLHLTLLSKWSDSSHFCVSMFNSVLISVSSWSDSTKMRMIDDAFRNSWVVASDVVRGPGFGFLIGWILIVHCFRFCFFIWICFVE